MWVSAAVVLVAGVCAAIDLPTVKASKRDLWIFAPLLLLGTTLGVAEALKVKIPNPLDWIAYVYGPFLK